MRATCAPSTCTQERAPARETSTPSSSRSRYAFCTVFGFTPSSAETARREGISSPSWIVPATTPRRTNRTICR